MIHIRSLFKTVALFCLSTVLCQGCWLFSKTKLIPKAPNKKVLQHVDQKVLESPDQEVLESIKQSDEETLNKQMALLLQQQFMPHIVSTASKDANEAALKKDMEERFGAHGKQNMAQCEEILRQSGLPDHQTKELIKLFEDASCKLQAKCAKLPSEKLQWLFDSMKNQEKLKKDFVETFKQLRNLLEKPVKSLKEDSQIDVEGNDVPEPIFPELIKATQEECKIVEDYIHPEDHRNLRQFQVIKNLNIVLYQKMEEAMLQCSAEEKKSYQSHLERLLSILQSSVKAAKALRKVIPDSLVGEIRQLSLEVGEQAECIIQHSC